VIVLLDSTLIIDALRRRPAALHVLQQVSAAGHTFAVSVINVAEVYAGMRSGEEDRTARFFLGCDVYPVTLEIARRGGELRNRAARRGQTLELDDMLVAATALVMDLTVYTDNVKDFKKAGVTFYAPSEN
jgi:predicted nucleic acid-binding protein